MDIVTGLVLYMVIWWTLLFAILPWGNKPSEVVPPGHAHGAPENPRLVLKFLMNSLLSGFLWILIYCCIRYEWISLDALCPIPIIR